MKVILVFVSTLNGMITRGDDPEVRHWSSKSDQAYYGNVWKQSSLVVMGSTTWRDNVIRLSPGRLVIVMTRKPGEYENKAVPGQLEFSALSPQELVAKFRSTGNEVMTVVGGPHIATSFLRDSLIDELWLTIEPRLFGRGQNLIAESETDVRLRLIDIVKANDEGTLLTKYAILR